MDDTHRAWVFLAHEREQIQRSFAALRMTPSFVAAVVGRDIVLCVWVTCLFAGLLSWARHRPVRVDDASVASCCCGVRHRLVRG